MIREDVQDLLAMIQGAYPNFKPENKTATVNAWHMALDDIDKNLIAIAFKAYMRTDTSGFAPSPGKLIELVCQSSTIGELEAWSMVSKAIRNSCYHADEEFDKLPDDVKRALGSADQLRIWAMDEGYNESVNSSNFMRTYRQVIERKRFDAKLPKDMAKISKDSQILLK